MRNWKLQFFFSKRRRARWCSVAELDKNFRWATSVTGGGQEVEESPSPPSAGPAARRRPARSPTPTCSRPRPRRRPVRAPAGQGQAAARAPAARSSAAGKNGVGRRVVRCATAQACCAPAGEGGGGGGRGRCRGRRGRGRHWATRAPPCSTARGGRSLRPPSSRRASEAAMEEPGGGHAAAAPPRRLASGSPPPPVPCRPKIPEQGDGDWAPLAWRLGERATPRPLPCDLAQP